MEIRVSYSKKEDIIQFAVMGTLTLEGVPEIVQRVTEVVREHDCHFILSDYRETKLEISISDIYKLPQWVLEQAQELDVELYRLKRALVISGSKEDFLFFETVSFNQSQNLKLFQDIDEARAWLQAGQSTGN